MKIELELPDPPEGYEYTGEFREPRKYEFFLDNNNLIEAIDDIGALYLILRKIKPPREFKDGAFYPVIYKSDSEYDVSEYDAQIDSFHTINYGQCIAAAFSWIGEELKIDWGE